MPTEDTREPMLAAAGSGGARRDHDQDRIIEIKETLARIDERQKAMELIAASRHAETAQSNANQTAQLVNLARKHEELADAITGLEGAMYDEIKRLDAKIDTERESTATRFGTTSNLIAENKIAIASLVGGTIKRVWFTNVWSLLKALVYLIVAGAAIGTFGNSTWHWFGK